MNNKTANTITEKQADEIILKELPELKGVMKHNAKGIYDTIEHFVGFTKKSVREGNFSIVKKCFRIAEYLLGKGNFAVKHAIENVFVYSIGEYISSINSCIELPPESVRKLKELFKGTLKDEYYKQVLTIGT